jgi:hypothetical protein
MLPDCRVVQWTGCGDIGIVFKQPDVAVEVSGYLAAGTRMASAIEKSTQATSVPNDMYCSPAFLSGLANANR